jgi:hypothetical protein
METVILAVGFIGAWLLFAGPIYQAALELTAENLEIDRDTIHRQTAALSQPAKVSVWWWLLPPVKIYLEQHRSDTIRHIYIQSLSTEQIEALTSFMNKASGWLFVAVGGLCIAIKETYELAEHLEWSLWLWGPLVIVLIYISIVHTILRIRQTKRLLSSTQA